jgi:hypothetical protein
MKSVKLRVQFVERVFASTSGRINRWKTDWTAATAIVILSCATIANGTSLRIVSYNIDDADQGNDNNITADYAGLPTVLQAIGQHHIGTRPTRIQIPARLK